MAAAVGCFIVDCFLPFLLALFASAKVCLAVVEPVAVLLPSLKTPRALAVGS